MGSNILIVGNGFDLYHNSPTRYTDFLTFVEYWDYFFKEYSSKTSGLLAGHTEPKKKMNISLQNGKLSKEAVVDMAFYSVTFEKQRISYLNEHLKTNKWIQYFNEIDYKKEGWIDFEREIETVLRKIENYFNDILPHIEEKMKMRITGENDWEGMAAYIPPDYDVIFNLFGEGIELTDESAACELDINNQFCRAKQKHLLLECMKNELDILIKCFNIYIDEFVINIDVKVQSEQIRRLDKVSVLSFNYTNTFKTVYPDHLLGNTCFVHGNSYDGNIVMGVSDDFIDNNDYIYFQKFFQRIQKRTGIDYENLLTSHINDGKPNEIYIMGHSLDRTDKGVLEKFVKTECKVHIFYYNQDAYEQQVIKLVEMFGKDRIINAVAKKEIVFELLKKACPKM